MSSEESAEIHEEDFDAQEIIPGLYLGSAKAANSLPGLRKRNIQHVICAAKLGAERKPFRKAINYVVWDCEDTIGFPIIWAYPSMVAYIEEALSKEEPVLVHCQAGISRSASVVCAYLMAQGYCKESVSQARGCYAMIREKRAQVRDRVFLDQLELWGRLRYKVWPPEEFHDFFDVRYDAQGTKVSKYEVTEELELLRTRYSIRLNKTMRESFLGTRQTVFPKIVEE